MTHNGLTRHYTKTLPSSQQPTGLVVAMLACPEAVAANTGVVVLCPQPVGGCWNAFENYGYCNGEQGESKGGGSEGGKGRRAASTPVDDVGFLAALIQQTMAQHSIPAGRTIVTGFSNGGSMAYRFNCERSDLIDGVVVINQAFFDPIVGFYDYTNDRVPPGDPQCSPQHSRPFYSVQGQQDGYYGLQPAAAGFEAVAKWRLYSTEVLGCTGELRQYTEASTFPQGPATCYEYATCPGNTANRMCSVQGMGHEGQPMGPAVERLLAESSAATASTNAKESYGSKDSFNKDGAKDSYNKDGAKESYGTKETNPDKEATTTEAPKEVTKPAATCKDAKPKFCQKKFATATAKKINRICNRKTFQRKCQASCSQIVQC